MRQITNEYTENHHHSDTYQMDIAIGIVEIARCKRDWFMLRAVSKKQKMKEFASTAIESLTATPIGRIVPTMAMKLKPRIEPR